MIEADPDYRRTKGILQKLRDNAHYPIPPKIRNDIYRRWQRTIEIRNIIQDLRTQAQKFPPKSKSMMNLLSYLGYVESIGVSLVDIGLILIWTNVDETHVRRKPRKRKDLFDKLQVLEEHGLDYIAKLIDRNLRNDIAHLKFEIDEKGTIKDSNKRKRNIGEITSQFWARVYSILSMFEDIRLSDWLTKPKQEP